MGFVLALEIASTGGIEVPQSVIIKRKITPDPRACVPQWCDPWMDEETALEVASPGFKKALTLSVMESSGADPGSGDWMRGQWDGLGTG